MITEEGWNHLYADAIDTLLRFGTARNREVDRVPREVCLTDDEAVAVLRRLGVVEV